jgi:hypothetical protein
MPRLVVSKKALTIISMWKPEGGEEVYTVKNLAGNN